MGYLMILEKIIKIDFLIWEYANKALLEQQLAWL